MARKVVVVADPGIDGAFALALALHDPDLDLLAVAATSGNVDAAQATLNVHALIEHIDPPRWPRVGAALPVEYDVDGRRLHGSTGLGSASLAAAQLHHPHFSDKLIGDFARLHPKELVVIVLGPLTVLARAIDRDPELPALLNRVICVGGSWRELGDVSVTAEFHFFCDPTGARQVLRSGAPITLLPLDVTQRFLFSPGDLHDLLGHESSTCRLLRKILPFGIGASSNLFGIEGFHPRDVLGVAALSLPSALTVRPMHVDVETKGELTRGMAIMDPRPDAPAANAEVAIDVDTTLVRDYVQRTLARAR
jgi:inosine-uridine nucleoside N-ribohydrolase